MRRTILLLILICLLIVPAFADDTTLMQKDPGWIGIMSRINVNQPNNIASDLLGQYIPDWARQENLGNFPNGTHYTDMEPYSQGSSHYFSFITNGTSGFGVYPIAGSIYDLDGQGKWTYIIKHLDGAVYTGDIYKTDFINFGLGYSTFNLTAGGKWFNTSVSQPRIIPLSATPFWWSFCYNLNSSENALMAFDGVKHLKIGDLSVGPDQNPAISFYISGPGTIKGKLFSADYDAMVITNKKMIQGPEADILTTARTIGNALFGVLNTLYILFDWFVLKVGFIYFILVIELGMLAVYVNTSKDFFTFMQKFIKGNRSFFEFMSKFIFFTMNVLMTLVTLFAQALTGAAGLVIALIGSLI